MSRTTVHLPDDVDARVRQEAARRGMTLSDWTREAIEAHLPGGGRPEEGRRRRLLARAAGHSGQHDISVRIREILRSEVSR
ncbi:MAG TPA: CopG family transcriptional regulator [Mycobacteriales bacterium]|nr:CopG family transcriptional regulator [Mycobacteriales bacterium]